MKKIIILIPVFNDWESLKKLLNEIEENVKDIKNILLECLVINDASTIKQPKLIKPKSFQSLKILNMKKNKGHARCNAFGIRFISKNKDFDNLILMDGDGEDRPVELIKLINKSFQDPENSVVAKRIKRSEGPFFQFLYLVHKIITLLFTGKKINFGNYSCLTKNDVKKLSSKASLWSSYSGSVKKNIRALNEIDSIRGERYFGPSKMSLYRLIIHSFSIIAVFKYQVLTRSILLILIIGYLNTNFAFSLILFQTLIILFCIAIFLVSLRENKEELFNSENNLENFNDVTH
tara:strand:- start:2857 stop:3729 length:873 start_codon:yes stop_codon:yes gene_type:complete